MHGLERDAAAEAEARALMERIRAAGRLDFDNDVPDPRFGVEKMYEPGGGKMLGVLLAERAVASETLETRRETNLSSTHRRETPGRSCDASSNAKQTVVLKAFSGQLYGEWRVKGWAPPLCALTHDAPRYVGAHEKIAAATAAARERRDAVAAMEARLARERETWDARVRETAERVKEARRARRARRAAASRRAEAATSGDDGGGDETDRDALEAQLAEESRADKRALARLREARATAMGPSESALTAAREEARALKNAHREMSASLLAEIFDSYRLPNFRKAFGFGHRRSATGREAGDRGAGLEARGEAPGATLAECFVADKAAAAAAADVSDEDGGRKGDDALVPDSSARASLPCGCGDCCAPKLLAECALRGLKPLSIAEVWMGVPTRAEGDREEGEFYGACRGRCRPILGHMLCGADEIQTRIGGPIVL